MFNFSEKTKRNLCRELPGHSVHFHYDGSDYNLAVNAVAWQADNSFTLFGVIGENKRANLTVRKLVELGATIEGVPVLEFLTGISEEYLDLFADLPI